MAQDFDLFQRRMKSRGNSEQERMISDKLYSFLQALKHSYQKEDVTIGGKDYIALVNDNKQNMDYDEKTLSVVFDAGCKVGQLVYWPRVKTYWLITTSDITERAYFRGSIREALYKIRWKSDDGTVYETWVVYQGASKGDGSSSGGNFEYDVPNGTASLIFGACDGAAELKRYSKIMIANKVWQIINFDNLTSPGLIKASLTEDYIDRDSDNFQEQIARDKVIVAEVASDIVGPGTVNPIDGLTQNYTINNADAAGVWNISDKSIGAIVSSDGYGATINFNGKVGSVVLTYSVDGTPIATKTVKVTTVFG